MRADVARRLAKLELAGGRRAIRCIGTITTESDEDQAAQIASLVEAGTYDPADPSHLLVVWRIFDPPAYRRPHA